MSEIINSSFIPKKEFKKKEVRNSGGPKLNIFFLISLIIFLSTVIASIGVYLWKIDLVKTNRAQKESLAARKDAYGIESVKKFSELSDRIESAKKLLLNHYNLLPIFTYLEKNTLVDITLKGLKIEEKENEIKVFAKGVASDLSDLQLQSRAYSKNPNVSSLVLSNITKNKQGETVFDLNFSVDKKYLTERIFLLSSNIDKQ